jgi:peptidoglycan hydrolase CwlO-like protein
METLSPTAPLFASFVHELARYIVPHVVAELRAQTNAEGMGMIALDPNNLALPVYTLMQHDDNIRDAIKALIEDQYNNDLRSIGTKLDELDNKVDDMESKVDDMESKVDDFDDELNAVKKNTPKVDADDSEFAGAVMAVLRKNI